MSHAEQQLPERSQKLVKQIDKAQDRLGSLISRMEVMEKKGQLNEAGRARLDTARELHSNLGKIRESVASTGALSASHEEMKRDINSWQSAAKYAGMETFEKVVTLGGLINPMGIKGGSKELMERQFDSLERAGSALTDFEISITKMVSNIDSMATALSKGDMEGFQKAAARYESGAKQMIRDADNMATAVWAMGEQREYFEGASKVAKGFFVDAAVVVATAGALSAVAKIGKVQNVIQGANAARAASTAHISSKIAAPAFATTGQKAAYGVARFAATKAHSLKSGYVWGEKAVAGTIESGFSLLGSQLGKGEITSSDFATCAIIVFPLASKLKLPGVSKGFMEKSAKMYERVQAGELTFKQFARWIEKEAPEISRQAREYATSREGKNLVKDPVKLQKYIVNLYEGKNVVAPIGHPTRTVAKRKVIDAAHRLYGNGNRAREVVKQSLPREEEIAYVQQQE